MNFFQKMKYKYEVKQQKLTPKGECFYQYCKKIIEGNLSEKDYIEAYEHDLEKMRTHPSNPKTVYSREAVARTIVNIMNDIKETDK